MPTSTSEPTATLEPTETPAPTRRPLTLQVDAGESVRQKRLSGTGEPGAAVEILANWQKVGEIDIDDEGTWHFDLTLDSPGTYALGARSIHEDGTAVGLSAAHNPNRTSHEPTLQSGTPASKLPIPRFQLLASKIGLRIGPDKGDSYQPEVPKGLRLRL